jgi:phage terminase large subunit
MIVDLGYRPRFYQKVLHQSLRRFNVLVCHRRFGKTIFAVMEMIDRAFRNERHNPQYAYIAPTFSQAERVVWTYLQDFLKDVPGYSAHQQKLTVTIARPDRGDVIKFMLLGSENPDGIRGIYLDGGILDEYAQCAPNVWGEIVRPALSDREGWAIFIGTPKGQNHFFDMLSRAQSLEMREDTDVWFTAIYKASQTQVIPAEELRLARMEMSEEEYQQEFECSFSAAMTGSYYGKYMAELEEAERIRAVPYERHALVNTYWDLGINDTTAIWFIQEVGQEFHVIDHLENSGVGLDYYASKLKEKGYSYGEHWLPHDGAARELGTGKSRQEILDNLGIRCRIAPKLPIADGIQSVRMLLNRCYFDRIKTERGVVCLKNYQRKWDARAKLFADHPLHDWTSNSADAFRTFAVAHRQKRPVSVKSNRVMDAYFNALE